MKHLPWIALVLAATPAAADTPPKSIGFYRLASITAEGKKVDLAEELKKSAKSQGGKFELDYIRMTIELETTKLTISIDQVIGERGSGTASYCNVSTSVGMTIANGKFTIPSIGAVANGGVVTTKSTTATKKDLTKTDTNTDKNTTKCNVSLDAGTYTIKGSGKTIELTYTSDGTPASLQLVAEARDVDLPARALAFAGKK